MSGIATASELDKLTLNITKEIHVNASLENTFEALLEQIGPENENPNGKMPMTIEAHPGGRWFRDLGNNNGHCWGTVQAIKRPELLEISGPLFMSYPVLNSLQYRLKKTEEGTLVSFHHTALGFIPDEVRVNLGHGWENISERIRREAEAKSKR